MFGAKPGGFGQPATNTGFGAFGTNTAAASPFGQTTAFSKPATGAFGATPAFGQQPTTSLFGQTQATGGLFGANTTTAPAFGAAATTQPGFGAFGQTQPQATSLFGTQNNTAANTSLFGNNNNTSFGTPKPAGFGGFGQTTTQTTSLFGQSSTNNTATTGFFGQNTQPAGGSGLFGAAKPAFGATAPVGVGGGNGTAVAKYQQTHGTDTLVKNGQTTTVNTKQHCITFMKDYENKSVEELRFEDYAVNRKGPQAGAGGLFGGGVQSTGLFGGTAGQQQQAGLFGQNQQQQAATGGLFGTSTNTFGATTTPAFGTTAGSTFNKPFGSNPVATSAPGFGFNQSTTSTLGGGLGVNKPAFGATGTTTGLFGQSAAPATSTFGQTPVFGGFGTQNAGTQQQAGGLFSGAGTAGQTTGAFGTLGGAAQQSSFSFGTNTQTSAAGSTLFGAKPTNTFGTLGGTTFGQGATSTAPTFGLGTNTNVAGGVGGGSFFGSTFNKTAAPAFGLGTNASTGTLGAGTGGGLTFGTGSTGLFGNTANKPGGLGTGTGLFGNTSTLGAGGGGAFGTMGGIGSTFGAGNTGGLGMGSLGGGLMGGTAMGTTGGQQTVPIHQQILAMASSPYGDNPIFKGIKPLVGPTEDSLKPTNPSAQKAILEGSNYQLKISSRSGGTDRVKVKPLGATQLKKSIFEGLEEYDSTLEDSFTLKPNAKRLIIKPRSTKPTIIIPEKAPEQATSSGGAYKSLGPSSDGGSTPQRTDTDGESFRNQIPQNPNDSVNTGKQQQQQQHQQQQLGSADSSRRVSWLQSNVLDKVRQQQQQQQGGNSRLSESVLDNTIKEFAVTANNRGEMATSASALVREGESDETDENAGKGGAGGSKGSGKENTSPVNESFISNRSFLNETSMIGGGIGTDLSTSTTAITEEAEPHPTGIVLRRAGYYTIPSLDEIAQLMDEDGRCVVPNFTIGRKGYGNVYFNEPIDVAGLNLDEIVHFRHKEVIIYPDDENKPPVGSGLNRKAQITLDQVWPHDKTLHEPIKDPQRLALLEYEAKLRRVCDRHDTRFLEYRPATGSWVFKVEHFSKYGLSDSDDEDGGSPADPKKVKMMTLAQQQQPKTQLLKPQTSVAGQGKDGSGGEVGALRSSVGQATVDRQQQGNVPDRSRLRTVDGSMSGFGAFGEDYGGGDENMNFDSTFGHHETPTSPTASIAMEIGMDPHKIQLMKASFFGDDDFDRRSATSEVGGLDKEGRESPDQIVPSGPGVRPSGLLLQSLYGSSKPVAPTPRKPIGVEGGLLRGDSSVASLVSFTQGSLLKTSTVKNALGGSSLSLSSSKQPQQQQQLQKQQQQQQQQQRPAPISGTKVTALPPIPRPVGPQALPLVVKPRTETLHPINMVIPLSKSILKRFLNNKSKLAFFHGRKFKIGWAHGAAMVQLNTRDNCLELARHHESSGRRGLTVVGFEVGKRFLRGRGEDDFSPAALQLLRIKSTADPASPVGDDDAFARSVEGHLQVKLRYDERRAAPESDCPHLVAGGRYLSLEEHAAQAQALYEVTGDRYDELCANVWSLLVTLWGAREELEDVDEAAHLTTMFRRDLLSEWIERVVTKCSQHEIERPEKRDYLDQLLELLRTHKVLEACELAFENNDINLSMLMAQISGGPTVRQLLQHQLSCWQDSEADRFIDPRRLQVFMAIAGIPLMSSTVHGPINLFDGADWLRALALHLWYLSSATASITDALFGYESSFQSDDFLARPPLPPYEPRYPSTVPNRTMYDVRFQLLKLFSKRSHPLEPLLNPASHTADPMDYRLSWLLLQELETLGYRHCSEMARNKLHIAFASQLETHGLWHWAIYVLLHLNDQSQRELAVQQLLYRHVQLPRQQSDRKRRQRERIDDDDDDDEEDDDEDEEDEEDEEEEEEGEAGERRTKRGQQQQQQQMVEEDEEATAEYEARERFVVDELGIPEKWIYWAKAVRAGSEFDYQRQTHYLLKAKQWALAHEVIMRHLAPEMMLKNKISQLKGMLDAIEDVKQISNWSTKGQILVDFIELNEKIELVNETIDEELKEQRLESLKPKLSDLCSMVKLFPCPTLNHTVLQSEIAERLLHLLREYFVKDPRISGSALLRSALERLPLPSMKSELDNMLKLYLDEELRK